MVRWGVLVISHGSRDEEWVKLVRAACALIRLPSDIVNIPIQCAFLEIVDGYLIQDGIDCLEHIGITDIIVVPLFISSGSTHIDEISWALGVQSLPRLETDLERFRVRANIHMCDPIDDDPEIAQLIVDKLKSMSADPSRELVLLVGHGSKEKDFYDRWRRGLSSLADQVKALGGFAESDSVMLRPDQAACKLKVWQRKRPELDVIVAPIFLSEGYFTSRVIPQRLAGFRYKYEGKALLPSPHVTAWMERRIISKLTKIETNG